MQIILQFRIKYAEFYEACLFFWPKRDNLKRERYYDTFYKVLLFVPA